MLSDLISSKTRIKLLLKFFLNSRTTSYLRGLAEEFDESTNAVRLELNRLEAAGMLVSNPRGNKKIYRANTKHSMYNEIHTIVRKHLGIDKVVLNIIERLGDLEQAYLTGPFANGMDSPIIDIILIGELEINYLSGLIEKVESMISKRIRYIHYTSEQWSEEILMSFESLPLLIWEKNQVSV
jgi:predicted transcriptional regulator